MQNFLARCAVLALLAGGFAFTGDVTRLLTRGRGILHATTIPHAAPPSAPETRPEPVTAPQAEAGSAAPTDLLPAMPPAPPAPPPGPAEGAPADQEPVSPPAAERPVDAPVGAPVPTTIPAGGPETVTIAALAPGDRVVVWIGRASGRARAAAIAFDIVDPATGDAIEVRHAPATDDAATLAPHRRVTLVGSVGGGWLGRASVTAGRIGRGQSLRIEPRSPGAADDRGAPQETIGPVVAIDVVRSPTTVP